MGESIYYILLTFLVAVAILREGRDPGKVLWFISAVFLVLFVGLRHKVGMDWNNYIYMTRWIAHAPFERALDRAEPSYVLLTMLSSKLGFGVYGVNLVVSMLFITGLYKLCASTPSPWLGLAVAFPMLIVVVANSATRQSAAIGALMWLIADWKNAGLTKRVIFVLIAASFHYSAFLFLALVAFETRQTLGVRLILIFVVVTVTAWLMGQMEPQTGYVSTYVINQAPLVISPGAFMHVILNAVPALVLLVLAWSGYSIVSNRFIYYLGLLALILFPVSIYYSTAASRLSFYLFPVSICVLAALPGVVSSYFARSLVVLMIGCLLILELWIWMNYANNRIAYITYRNAVFVNSQELHLK